MEIIAPSKIRSSLMMFTHIENCIVESRDTIRANTNYTSEDGKIRIVVEKNERYAL